MTLLSANDNRTATLNDIAPEHKGFQIDWICEHRMIKSIEYYEAYLEERMRA